VTPTEFSNIFIAKIFKLPLTRISESWPYPTREAGPGPIQHMRRDLNLTDSRRVISEGFSENLKTGTNPYSWLYPTQQVGSWLLTLTDPRSITSWGFSLGVISSGSIQGKLRAPTRVKPSLIDRGVIYREKQMKINNRSHMEQLTVKPMVMSMMPRTISSSRPSD